MPVNGSDSAGRTIPSYTTLNEITDLIDASAAGNLVIIGSLQTPLKAIYNQLGFLLEATYPSNASAVTAKLEVDDVIGTELIDNMYFMGSLPATAEAILVKASNGTNKIFFEFFQVDGTQLTNQDLSTKQLVVNGAFLAAAT